MGELGYDEQTPLEDKALRKQIELAKEYLLPIMIHTPHRDKRAGTLRTMDVLKEHKFDPARCVIDHNNERSEEHTSELQSHLNLVCRLLLEKKNKKYLMQHRP